MKENKNYRDPVLMNTREFLQGCLQPDIRQRASTVQGNALVN
jgi:hypothetical protein